MKRFFTGVLLLVVVILIAAIVGATFFLGGIVKTGVETVGPQVVGVPVTLESAKVSLLAGQAQLKALQVGNPEGFKTEYALRVGEVRVDLQPGSVFSDRILINEIMIDGPEIQYEVSLAGTNIGKLQEGLTRPETAPKTDEPEPQPQDDKPAKTVQISRFVIRNAKLRLAASLTGDSSAVLPLPTIELHDIGKEKEGATWTEVTHQVLNALAGAAKGVVVGSGRLAGKGFEAASDMTAKGIGLATDAAGQGASVAADVAAEGARLVGSGAGTLGRGAKKGTAIAGEGAQLAGEGAKKVVGGLTGMFRKDEAVKDSE
jgi:hypothetical protein